MDDRSDAALRARASRRALLKTAGASALLVACHHSDEDEKPVTATEDLMREHGVIRRVLVVYREIAQRLRQQASSVPFDALQHAAQLIRTFGEDYHERQLEEAHIFPALKQARGAIAPQVDVLIDQHRRSREITDHLIALKAEAIDGQASALAQQLEGFARMYELHTAIEDTIVFPAWKSVLSTKQLAGMGEQFEEIEHKTFGHDGFDDAVEQVASIEQRLGLSLAQFTAPALAPG